jgi:hypothetical protein
VTHLQPHPEQKKTPREKREKKGQEIISTVQVSQSNKFPPFAPLLFTGYWRTPISLKHNMKDHIQNACR